MPETFSGIASIEMFEAVGESWWPVFFQRVRELLPHGVGGRTADDHHRRGPLRGLPRQPRLHPALHLPGRHAAQPRAVQGGSRRAGAPRRRAALLRRQLRTHARRSGSSASRRRCPQVRDLGFDERFVRMWRYYLAYCRAGFSAGTIDVMQVRLER